MSRYDRLGPRDRISRCLIALFQTQPFFAAMAMRLKVAETDKIPTMGTDGAMLWYNKDFVMSLTQEELQGVVVHEVYHVTLLHPTRLMHREHRKFNEACDYVVNPMVREAGFTLPKGCLEDPKYTGKSAEEVYSLLPTQPPQPKCGKGSNCGPGEISKPGTGPNGDEDPSDGDEDHPFKGMSTEAIEQQIKQAVAAAYQVAKEQGKVPAGMDRLIDEIMDPQVPWIDVLRQWMIEAQQTDYSWRKLNRLYVGQDMYMPTLYDDALGEIALFVDTSGSIGPAELQLAANEINGIKNMCSPHKVHILYVDAEVARHDVFEEYDDIVITPAGGGGTDFRPPFKKLARDGINPKFAIYITDGYGPFPHEHEVKYPVLWVITNEEIDPPFGQVLRIKPGTY